MTAMRSPCFSVRRWRSSVVLPAPRKPVRMETGTDDDSLAIDSLGQPGRRRTFFFWRTKITARNRAGRKGSVDSLGCGWQQSSVEYLALHVRETG